MKPPALLAEGSPKDSRAAILLRCDGVDAVAGKLGREGGVLTVRGVQRELGDDHRAGADDG